MKKRLYQIPNFEEAFMHDIEETPEERYERLRDKNIAKYRVRSIWAGDHLEIEGFPLWSIPVGKRKKKENTSSAAQKRLNDRNTEKRITRIVHANFETGKDLWSTWPYDDEKLPLTPEQAKRDMTNFIRRQKHWLKKQEKYKNFELKYIYVTEFDERPGKKIRIHHHMISNFPDRDILENLWNGGGRVQTRRLREDENGLAGVVNYILKQPAGRNTKRYSISRNMKTPKVTEADSKMTRKRAEKIACGELNTKELFEKMYKGYQFNDIEVKFSEFTSGAYIYVRMKKIESITNTRKRE